jgi:hypothetical protein
MNTRETIATDGNSPLQTFLQFVAFYTVQNNVHLHVNVIGDYKLHMEKYLI